MKTVSRAQFIQNREAYLLQVASDTGPLLVTIPGARDDVVVVSKHAYDRLQAKKHLVSNHYLMHKQYQGTEHFAPAPNTK